MYDDPEEGDCRPRPDKDDGLVYFNIRLLFYVGESAEEALLLHGITAEELDSIKNRLNSFFSETYPELSMRFNGEVYRCYDLRKPFETISIDLATGSNFRNMMFFMDADRVYKAMIPEWVDGKYFDPRNADIVTHRNGEQQTFVFMQGGWRVLEIYRELRAVEESLAALANAPKDID